MSTCVRTFWLPPAMLSMLSRFPCVIADRMLARAHRALYSYFASYYRLQIHMYKGATGILSRARALSSIVEPSWAACYHVTQGSMSSRAALRRRTMMSTRLASSRSIVFLPNALTSVVMFFFASGRLIARIAGFRGLRRKRAISCAQHNHVQRQGSCGCCC